MKKQLLTAAIAASMSLGAMANITISGKANFEYTNTVKTQAAVAAVAAVAGVDAQDAIPATAKQSINGTDTEISLNFRASSGDTKVVLDLEFDDHGSGSASTPSSVTTTATGATQLTGTNTVITAGTAGTDSPIDVENAYITTKIGPVALKLGNWTPSNSGLLGEISLNSRGSDKVHASYNTDAFEVYAGFGGAKGDDTAHNSSMYFGGSVDFSGWKVYAERMNGDDNAFGVQGKVSVVGIRFEYSNGDLKKNKGYYIQLDTEFSDVNLTFATIQMKENGGIGSDDSSIFSSASAGYGKSNTAIKASTTIDGTTYTGIIGMQGAKVVTTATGGGTIEHDKSRSYYKVSASRKLASGITVAGSYYNKDTGLGAKTKQFEIDMSVKF